MATKPKPKPKPDDAPFAVPEWPQDSRRWPLKNIKPSPDNPRTHPPEQIKLLAQMLLRWGPDQPIVVDEDGFIIKGHGRRAAAELAAFEEFPIVQRFGLSKAEKRAMRIADNQTALLSGWDQEKLRLQFNELNLEKFDIKLLGFNEAQLYAFSIGFEQGATDPTKEWAGMPEFVQGSKVFKTIFVHFENQNGVDKFSALVGQKITPETKFIWYPETKRESTLGKVYASKGKKK